MIPVSPPGPAELVCTPKANIEKSPMEKQSVSEQQHLQYSHTSLSSCRSAGAGIYAKDSGGPVFPLKMLLTGSQITFLHSTTPIKFAFAQWALNSSLFFCSSKRDFLWLWPLPSHVQISHPELWLFSYHNLGHCGQWRMEQQHLQHRYQTSTFKYYSEIQNLCASNFNVNKQRWTILVHQLLPDIEGSSKIPFLLWVRV